MLLAVAFIVAGCAQVREEKKEDVLAVEPNLAAFVVTADYASGAIGATGGLNAWTKTIKLELDGVVTFYQMDNSFYLTEHHFEVYPWSNSIRVSAQEPLSKFVWQLAGGEFSLLEGNKAVDVSQMVVSNRDYAEVMLSIVTTPVRFLDTSVGFIKSPTPVKKEGLWYWPIELTYPIQPVASADNIQEIVEPVQPYWPQVVFFQNTNS